MMVLVNTDNHLGGSIELAESVAATVEDTLAHLARQLTRVEVHLSDENSFKTGTNDIRCAMEARIEGHPPTAVTFYSNEIDIAVNGAAEKLKATLEHLFGKLDRS